MYDIVVVPTFEQRWAWLGCSPADIYYFESAKWSVQFPIGEHSYQELDSDSSIQSSNDSSLVI
jgi:hypothetical protein